MNQVSQVWHQVHPVHSGPAPVSGRPNVNLIPPSVAYNLISDWK
jgi:hypothetical protein